MYVPAGTPHRIVPLTESVQLRYKASNAGMEGVTWFCEPCGVELARVEWDTAEIVPQRAYAAACAAFNDSQLRTCRGCGAEHPPVDLEDERAAKRAKSEAVSAQP